MRKILLFLLISLLFLPSASAQSLRRGKAIITEEDGSPSVVPWKIKFDNATLTKNADGSVSHSIDGFGTSTYLKLDASNDPLTNTLTGQSLAFTANETYDIGDSTNFVKDTYLGNNVNTNDTFCRFGSDGGVDTLDFEVFSKTAGKHFKFNGTSATPVFTTGVDANGIDVKFFGTTTGKYLLWDESADALNLSAAYLIIPSGTTPAPTTEGAVFLDTDAGVNGTLKMYSNGAWRNIQAF